MPTIIVLNDTSIYHPFPHAHYTFLRLIFFHPTNMYYPVFCLYFTKWHSQNSYVTHFIELHSSHVSRRVNDVWHWRVIFNTVPLCSCPTSICVHLYVSCRVHFSVFVAFVPRHFLFSSYPCLCGFAPVGPCLPFFVFHPCLFIRTTFQQSGT